MCVYIKPHLHRLIYIYIYIYMYIYTHTHICKSYYTSGSSSLLVPLCFGSVQLSPNLRLWRSKINNFRQICGATLLFKSMQLSWNASGLPVIYIYIYDLLFIPECITQPSNTPGRRGGAAPAPNWLFPHLAVFVLAPGLPSSMHETVVRM